MRGDESPIVSQSRVCPQCDYDWNRLPDSGRCPECGFQYDEHTHVIACWRNDEQRLTKTQRFVVYSIYGAWVVWFISSIFVQSAPPTCCSLIVFLFIASAIGSRWATSHLFRYEVPVSDFIVVIAPEGLKWRRRMAAELTVIPWKRVKRREIVPLSNSRYKLLVSLRGNLRTNFIPMAFHFDADPPTVKHFEVCIEWRIRHADFFGVTGDVEGSS